MLIYSTYTYYNNNCHRRVNDVDGLDYSIYEAHNVINGVCANCDTHIHDFDYEYYNLSRHKLICSCGYTIFAEHYGSIEDANDGNSTILCLGCRAIILSNNGNVNLINTYQSNLNHGFENIVLIPLKDIFKYELGIIGDKYKFE